MMSSATKAAGAPILRVGSHNKIWDNLSTVGRGNSKRACQAAIGPRWSSRARSARGPRGRAAMVRKSRRQAAPVV